MSYGEPAFHAAFDKRNISPIAISYYRPKTNGVKGDNISQFPTDGFSLPGALSRVVKPARAGHQNRLKKHEQFKRSITENGYGVELAIPWRFLKNYAPKYMHRKSHQKKSLRPGEMFFYKLSLKKGNGMYSAGQVRDNMGDCCGGLGKSGNILFTNLGSKTSTLTPGQKFRIQLAYLSKTQAKIDFGLEEVHFSNLEPTPGKTPSHNFKVEVIPDSNCNNRIDRGESKSVYTDPYNELAYLNWYYDPDPEIGMLYGMGASVTSSSYGKSCFIVDVTVPPDGSVAGADIAFETSTFFNTGIEGCCDICGGKPINPVGSSTTRVGARRTAANLLLDTVSDVEVNQQLELFPNPSTGNINIRYPKNVQASSILVYDVSGKLVQGFYSALSSINLNKSAPGIYIVKIQLRNSTETIVRKIIIH